MTSSNQTIARKTRLINIPVGTRFGRLVVHSYHGNVLWKCNCDCGNTTLVAGGSLRRGATVSCGCYRAEIAGTHSITHGQSFSRQRSRIYRVWASMKNRCLNPNNKAYKNYGARGIGVCDRWRDSFTNFFQDMGHPPSDAHSLERIDNNLDYSPTNCIWADIITQANNKRTTRFLTLNGVTKPFAHWCREFQQPYALVYERIVYLHWDAERALTVPRHTKT